MSAERAGEPSLRLPHGKARGFQESWAPGDGNPYASPRIIGSRVRVDGCGSDITRSIRVEGARPEACTLAGRVNVPTAGEGASRLRVLAAELHARAVLEVIQVESVESSASPTRGRHRWRSAMRSRRASVHLRLSCGYRRGEPERGPRDDLGYSARLLTRFAYSALGSGGLAC